MFITFQILCSWRGMDDWMMLIFDHFIVISNTFRRFLIFLMVCLGVLSILCKVLILNYIYIMIET